MCPVALGAHLVPICTSWGAHWNDQLHIAQGTLHMGAHYSAQLHVAVPSGGHIVVPICVAHGSTLQMPRWMACWGHIAVPIYRAFGATMQCPVAHWSTLQMPRWMWGDDDIAMPTCTLHMGAHSNAQLHRTSEAHCNAMPSSPAAGPEPGEWRLWLAPGCTGQSFCLGFNSWLRLGSPFSGSPLQLLLPAFFPGCLPSDPPGMLSLVLCLERHPCTASVDVVGLWMPEGQGQPLSSQMALPAKQPWAPLAPLSYLQLPDCSPQHTFWVYLPCIYSLERD